MGLRRATKTPEPTPGPTPVAYCEGSWVTSNTPWHIRELTAAGPKPGGGADTSTLCGRDLRGGWDITRPVEDAPEVLRLSEHVVNGHPVVCPACAAVYATD